ncbi:MAG: 3-phosphoshikimate 1-carboxyvinyltransferase, partial [Clostridia bacterium]|nr:3-phosphoshikimate 1-carboxyvinyltransferase [Clostridia bacterium]
TGIIDVLRDMGADLSIENVRISAGESVADITVKSSALRGATVEGAIIPRLIDELPVIAVAAAVADGETVIKDAAELKVKETNRIRAVVDEFKKCGIDITETDDGMIIRGGKAIRGADFKTYGDHRMAMSLTVLAQLADGGSTIDDAECVNISYPGFFENFYSLGK